jgi:alpha-N-arabinofuranosidase
MPDCNFLSKWDWHQGLGARNNRIPMFDHARRALQTNDIYVAE